MLTADEEFFIKQCKHGIIRVMFNGDIWHVRLKRKMGRLNDDGYVQLTMKDGKKIRHMYAHRLVYIIRRGYIPSGKEINHIDGNKSNNRPRNFNLKTRTGNIKHAYDNNLRKFSARRFTKSQVRAIREDYHSGSTNIVHLAKKYGSDRATVRAIVNYRTYKNI